MVTRNIISDIEQLTHGQKLNPLWSQMRAGRLTFSTFGDVLCACRRQSVPPSLLSSLLNEYNLEGDKSVEWGAEHELTAVREYQAASDVFQNRDWCNTNPVCWQRHLTGFKAVTDMLV